VFGWLSFTSLLITQWDNMHCSYCISVSRWWFTFCFTNTRINNFAFIMGWTLIYTEDFLHLCLLNCEYFLSYIFSAYAPWCFYMQLMHFVVFCSPYNFTIVILLFLHEKFETCFKISHYLLFVGSRYTKSAAL
jgi:hypothetical protein